MPTAIPLQNLRPDLALAGGKGANLAILTGLGLPVPPGFCITTAAYHQFVESNHLAPAIAQALEQGSETASAAIRLLFDQGQVPPALQDEICMAYASLGQGVPVAVRSSATAEDLPDLSFAGQQDTFLNVVGEQEVLLAVVRCWSSLWTARAIEYRQRNHIPHADVGLAVIVQAMVPAEASGVLFTANPLTGQRDQTVIDATLGLGEALVSGQVDPDHYVVSAGGQIVSRVLGTKSIAIRPQAGGGTRTVAEDAADRQALPDDQIVELAEMGRRVQAHYGAPQDIEWAWANGKLFLLQARPVTSLYPVPVELDPEPLRVMVSLGAVQGLLDPFTPLGLDMLRALVVTTSAILGYRVTMENQRAFLPAGMRLFINITPILTSPLGRRIVTGAADFVEPGSAGALKQLLSDPRLAPGKLPVQPRTALRLVPRFARVFWVGFTNTLLPERARRVCFQQVSRLLNEVGDAAAASRSLSGHLEVLQLVLNRIPYLMLYRMVPTFAPAMAMLNFLNHVARDVPDGDRLVWAITRGMPYNVTTEMDLALWETAVALKADPASASQFVSTPAIELAQAYLSGSLPAATQRAVQSFIDRYGMRGVAELDLGRPRWSEDPVFVMQALQSYLQIGDRDRAPDRVFASSADEAGKALDELVHALEQTPGGRSKARRARIFAGRVRALGGFRELPKFTIIRLMGIARQGFLESGRRLVSSGLLQEPEDIFFLSLRDLEALAPLQKTDGFWAAETRLPPGETLAEKVASGRATYSRELLRRQVPRLLLSDGRAIYESPAEAGQAESEASGVLSGTPVSPGVAEGIVRVVLNPHGVTLQPGEILVCPGTDPGWTPLFLAAGALVMEVGGMMTHGSVVAREYGLPAVVGVPAATTRLQTGQRVRVDGNRGVVTILEQ